MIDAGGGDGNLPAHFGLVVGTDDLAKEGMMARAVWNGGGGAASEDVPVVDGYTYFPRDAVRPEYLLPSEHRSHCSWKGETAITRGKSTARRTLTPPGTTRLRSPRRRTCEPISAFGTAARSNADGRGSIPVSRRFE
jgi:hypothetical protein